MYGGGFATVPAYLADMFGTQFVGAIHGRLLTAWSTAGIIGPVVVNYIREAADRRRRAADVGLRCHHVYPGRLAGARAGVQSAGAAAGGAMVHAGQRGGEHPGAGAAAAEHGGSYGIGRGGLDRPGGAGLGACGCRSLWGAWVTLDSALVLFR